MSHTAGHETPKVALLRCATVKFSAACGAGLALVLFAMILFAASQAVTSTLPVGLMVMPSIHIDFTAIHLSFLGLFSPASAAIGVAVMVLGFLSTKRSLIESCRREASAS